MSTSFYEKKKKNIGKVLFFCFDVYTFLVSQSMDVSIGNFGILFLGLTERSKPRHQSLFIPKDFLKCLSDSLFSYFMTKRWATLTATRKQTKSPEDTAAESCSDVI
jgi:hypothetical protein